MAPTTKPAAGPQATEASADVGAFMLTLCRLEAPVSIRPSQNPQLARFKFFMSRARHADGQQSLYLHMGYFPTLAEAERCAHIMRPRYPHAVATRVPAAQPPVLHAAPPAEAGPLTDTQVLQILETRRVHISELGGQLPERPEISLLRPDDTSTRRALKDAVVQNAPISFVVQLCRSGNPIQLGTVPSLDIFRAYTLYLAEGAHEGRSWHALRLGFFSDAVSAKQVAHYARASFATVAVVPINESERSRAGEKPVALAHLAKPAPASIDEILAADQANSAAVEKPKPPAAALPTGTTAPLASAKPARRKDVLEQTLEMLAASELWSNGDSDSLSETGVKHLKVEIQKRGSRRS